MPVRVLPTPAPAGGPRRAVAALAASPRRRAHPLAGGSRFLLAGGRRLLPALRLPAWLLAAGLLGTGLSMPTAAQTDQVFWRNARGEVRTDNGTVTENTLTETVLEESDGDEQKRASDVVVRVAFGNVPPAVADGRAYMDRGDHENAAAKFRLAAGDEGTRPVLRAYARLMAARALMEQAKSDPAAFGEARSELESFLSDHADNRDVPDARMLLGRAQHLAGDPAAAVATYQGLFQEAGAGTPTTGYPLALCYEAGVAAARTALDQGDADTARSIYSSLESTLPGVLGGLEEGAPERARLLAVQSAARLGEGFVLLASDQANQAVTFFRTQVQNAPSEDAALRFGARLGLGEALLASGKPREAQMELAQVSSLDFTSRERVARALVGLAEATLALPDSNARSQAKVWVDAVLQRYADTPAVLRARELAKGF